MARIFKIDKYDVANGPGVRTSIWFSGCNKGCPGCHNEMLQDFQVGEPFTELTMVELCTYLASPEIDGRLSILGGEPLSRINVEEIYPMLYTLRKRIPHLNVWLWTGHEFEYLLNRDMNTAKAIELCDVVVDGPYIESRRSLQMPYQGSENQRVIDVQESLIRGYTISM